MRKFSNSNPETALPLTEDEIRRIVQEIIEPTRADEHVPLLVKLIYAVADSTGDPAKFKNADFAAQCAYEMTEDYAAAFNTFYARNAHACGENLLEIGR